MIWVVFVSKLAPFLTLLVEEGEEGGCCCSYVFFVPFALFGGGLLKREEAQGRW